MKVKKIVLNLAIFFVFLISLPILVAANEPLELENLFDNYDHYSGKIYTMVDEKGEVIMRTAREIVVGDEYINLENNFYRVKAVEGERATAVLVEKIVPAKPPEENFLQRVERLLRIAIPVQQGEGEVLTRRNGGAANAQAAAQGTNAMALRSVFWVFLGLIVVVGVFMLVSAGGIEQLKQKLGDFKNKEFTNTLGLPGGNKKVREAVDCCHDNIIEGREKDGG